MVAVRPDPDRLLERVQREEARARRGKLTVYLGASAGVGKTYAMLRDAKLRLDKGVNVLVGYVEPHGRPETEAMLAGLERLPSRQIAYRGRTFQEFDLDAALERKPGVILVDELAHSNPVDAQPQPRHAKRWQDIEELLDAGIDVCTTVNVQHIESLNDVVAGITGVRMQETVPDAVIEHADEVLLIDISPDELLERLHAGKIYLPDQAKSAIENFFRKGNLIALRELALRTAADRVDRAMHEYREGHGIRSTWAAGERILVAIGPDDQGERVLRAGKRLAAALHADWVAVYVETPDLLRLKDAKRNERIALLRLAESLGAEAVTLGGASAGEEISNYARERNVTRVVMGRPRRALWRRVLRPSTAEELVARTEGMDVIVVGGADHAAVLRNPVLARSRAYFNSTTSQGKSRWRGYLAGIAATALCTMVGLMMSPAFELVNVAMVYLLAVVIVAVRYGRGPATATSVAAVGAFDFFFVPPQLTFAVSDVQYVVTFVIMLGVGLLVSDLTSRVRLQASVAGHRERRTALLYAMSRELAATRDLDTMARVAVRHVSEVFDAQVVVLLPDSGGRLRHPGGAVLSGSYRGAALDVAQWVFDHGEVAGFGTDTLPATEAVYLPLRAGQGMQGAVALLPANPRRILLPEQFHLLETFAAQIALALERAQLADRAQRAVVQAETEGLRNALLASISHDLRTPLAVIAGASSSLADRGELLAPAARTELARSIYAQSQQMTTLVSNVLQMTHLESGLQPERDWHHLDEIVATTAERLRGYLAAHRLRVWMPDDLPLLRVDAVLIEQVLANLIENAAKYTPRGTMITVAAELRGAEVIVSIADEGPGLPEGDPERLFEKFHRGRPEGHAGGVGLGLTICRAIVLLHGGRIWAERCSPHGAVFRFSLPVESAPPVPDEAAF